MIKSLIIILLTSLLTTAQTQRPVAETKSGSITGKVVNEKEPSSTTIQFWKRGKAYLQLGEAERALADFNFAIREYANCDEDFLLRAQVHRRLGTEAAAQDDLRLAEKFAARPETEKAVACGHHHLDRSN